jgi:acyl carrier protein
MEVLRDDVPLSGPESGLDSIAVAEIVLECEEHFGVSLATLLESGLITITTIDDHVFRTER